MLYIYMGANIYYVFFFIFVIFIIICSFFLLYVQIVTDFNLYKFKNKFIHSFNPVYSLGTDSLACRCVRRHQHRLIVVDAQDGFTLEWVEKERVFLQGKRHG